MSGSWDAWLGGIAFHATRFFYAAISIGMACPFFIEWKK
jgi:hypothetical protein